MGYAWLEGSGSDLVQYTLNNHYLLTWKYMFFHKNGPSQNLSISPSIDKRFLQQSIAL